MYPELEQHINIHAHRGAVSGEEWVLQNLSVRSYPPDEADPDAAWSVGLHPWDIEKAGVDQALKKVQLATENCQVLAVGEAGLDATIQTPMDLQEKVFRAQVEIAEMADLPVVIHAVKSYQELIGFAKAYQPAVPMIIHGFRGGAQLAGDLLKFGFLLSFGEALLKSAKVAAAFREVPDGKFFLETDESDVDIARLYERAAHLRSVSLQALRTEQHWLFRKIFNRE
ncbi:MAG: TatD family hydrolase [Bacteroidales bacterium]|nr:TatD family hydrolase [Bacteroidales bacterium]MDT8432876.1 TatD family hydrolase [Bacteroidales bacterium]